MRLDRDLRVDFVRGFSLWAIFVNHTPGNWLGYVTPRNYTLADATEAFVLLAGYAAGLAYGLVLDRQGWFFAASRVMGRVFTLYVAHIFLLVVFTAQVGLSAARLDSAAYLDELHLDPFAADPYRALLEALLLRYQPSFLNILPLYITLLALFAFTMPLLRRPWLMLAASTALWAAARVFDITLPSWRGEDWFFNPLAWQLLFFIGCAMGYRPPGGRPLSLPWRRWAGLLCAALLAAGAVMTVLIYFRWDIAEARLPAFAPYLAAIDKASLHPMRLLTILALTYLIAHLVPKDAAWLRSRPARPLILMGQQALPVFCAGIALSFLGRVALEEAEGWAMQAAVNLGGAAALVGLAVLTAWYGAEKRGGRRPATQGLPTPAATDNG
ncbi:MAG TPA: OpgC domain-containing protein [Roseomonas sp.]|nr:OpgC domain-containing protein [Roseomonas sp.]